MDDDLIFTIKGTDLKRTEFRWRSAMYINKNEFTKGPVQDGLTEALGWCRDNNEHGKDMPGYHAAALLNAGIFFWDPDHEMYDIIEPIKSWLEPHKVEPNGT